MVYARPLEGYSVACALGSHSRCSGDYGAPVIRDGKAYAAVGACKCECHTDVREGYGNGS